ncbi:Hypothetical_protein [Hexamita inflata]|uniref:Hypothetical_protein n=1 Tax=Hexamita inflata TaxID=28002 RepID=A0AA86R0L5_9EUKA|nr:Hypothetical protein HINF_LOCUS55670 [Hexamita inflata]
MFTLLVPYHTLNVNGSRFLPLQPVQKILKLVHFNILDWSRVVIQKYYRINSSYLLGRFPLSKQVQLYFHLQIQGGGLGFTPLYVGRKSGLLSAKLQVAHMLNNNQNHFAPQNDDTQTDTTHNSAQDDTIWDVVKVDIQNAFNELPHDQIRQALENSAISLQDRHG